MSDLEQRAIHALACCTFVPGTATKRFARETYAWAKENPAKDLSPRQRGYLFICVYHFRRQIPPAIVNEVCSYIFQHPEVLDGFRLSKDLQLMATQRSL